ncbi:MAG: DHA2 family efflux MFS transporter permease subunit [Alphaproteobacteria bacterium]|nr:DHA2 family efflux MFS transporter permease subunit [Alphaproteobacteria bacterium]
MITVAVMLATIMQALDTTIANVALPHMQGGLSATQDQISWVLTSYLVATAIMIPPTGALARRFGRKRLFLVAVGGFTVASMLCGAAGSLAEIVVYRLLQGAFGASLVPLSQAVLLDTYPREKYGRAMAMWGLGVMVGPILGPTLGGYLTEFHDWRWIFYINLPFGLLALFGIAAFLPETNRDRERGFDWFGFLLLSLAVGLFQLMLDRGELKDWFASPEILAAAVLSLLFLYMFLVHMFTAERPFIEPRLFHDRNFSVGLLLMFVVGALLLSSLALLPPFMSHVMDYPVLLAGQVIAPRGIGTALAMLLVGRMINRIEPRLIILLGLLVAAWSMHLMAGFTPDMPASALIWTGVVQGFGLGFIFVPLSTIAFATLAPDRRTEGAAMFSLMRNLGGSIGISVVVGLVVRNTQANHAAIAGMLDPFRLGPGRLAMPEAWDWHAGAGAAHLNEEVTRQAAALAYVNDFHLMTWVSLLAVPLLLLFRPPAQHAAPG